MNLPAITTDMKTAKVDTSKISLYGVPIVAILVALVVAFFVVWPKFSDALSLRASNQDLALRVGALERKVNVLSSLDRFELESQLALSEQILPSDKGTFGFVRQIESAAASSGIFLDQVDLVPGTLDAVDSAPVAGTVEASKQTIAPTLQVRVSTTSNYASLLTFLNTLFSISRVVGISELIVASEVNAEGASALKASFLIDAFWKPLPGQLGSIESPVTTLTAAEIEILDRVKTLEVSGGAPASVVPTVPTGRADLFTPF